MTGDLTDSAAFAFAGASSPLSPAPGAVARAPAERCRAARAIAAEWLSRLSRSLPPAPSAPASDPAPAPAPASASDPSSSAPAPASASSAPASGPPLASGPASEPAPASAPASGPSLASAPAPAPASGPSLASGPASASGPGPGPALAGGLALVPGAEAAVPQLLRTLKQIATGGAPREPPAHGTAESASTAGESGSQSSASSCSSGAVDADEGETNKLWEEIRVHFDTVYRLVRNRQELSAALETALGNDWCLSQTALRGADRDASEPPLLFAEESSPSVPSTLNHRAAPFESRVHPPPCALPRSSLDAAPYHFSGAGFAAAAGRRAVDIDSPDNGNGTGGSAAPAPPSSARRSMSSSLSSPAVTFNLESREEMMRRRTAAAAHYGMKSPGENYYDARPSNSRNAPVSPLQTFVNLSSSRGYCPFDYLLVLDFEATCEEVVPPSYLHEIIEFPVVVVDVRLQRKVAEFHRFVKPKVQPQLSDFCRRLTGIRQEDVDNAPCLEDVIQQFERWYASTIPHGSRTMFATDGSADLREFMYTHSVLRQGVRFPSMFYQWIDVKRSFAHYFQCQQGKIKAMLDALHCPLEGRLHSGMDDARNVATIVTRMLQLGYSFCEIPLSRLTYATPAASSVGNFLPASTVAVNGTTSEDANSRRDSPGTV